jgi:putative phosphonate catabolism associated alcohol dehydrogenase
MTATPAPAQHAPVRAQVWHGGPDFALTEVPLPELAPGEAVAAVELATVCGSDRHTVSGRRAGACPSILGHEAVGRLVASHPAGVRDVHGDQLVPGDRLVWGVTASCGRCDRCRGGLTAKCRALLKTGHEPLEGPWPLSGGYATHIHLRQGLALVRVPETVSDAAAAVAACAGATVMACLEAAAAHQDLTGRRVLINGAGMLGLFACATARHHGAAVVEIRDTSPHRVATALGFGATHGTVVPAEGACENDATGLFDVAIELSGAMSGVRSCLADLDVGGRLVLAGSVAPAGTLELDPERIVRSWQSITGVHNYEPRHLQQAVDFLEHTHDTYAWDTVIAAPVPLAGLPGLLTGPETDPGILRRSIAPAPSR